MTGTTERGASAEPRAGRIMRVRAAAALGMIAASLLLLVGRLYQLQIAQADRYREMARQQQTTTRMLPGRRGTIYDRTGKRLADSLRVWSVFADPHQVKEPARTAACLARVLGVDAAALEDSLGRRCRFVWVKRHVSEGQADEVHALDLPGVHMRREYERFYPQGAYGAHVVGFTDIDGLGLAGIELEMDRLLTGRPGIETVRCDGGRRVIRSAQDHIRREPVDGYNIHLTLDLCTQIIAEQALDEAVAQHKPEGGLVIVMDARNGAILAMAARPAFDPRRAGHWPAASRRNIAVTDAYEFGSALKPVGIALALEAGAVTLDEEFDCHNGSWRATPGRVVHDVHEYGRLTVRDILIHSSNIGAAQVCLKLGAGPLYAGIVQFGYDRPSGVALPGEAGGIMLPQQAWTHHSVISASFGQEVAVTPIAMVRAFAAFANGGRLPPVRIVDRIEDPATGEVVYSAAESDATTQAVSAETARQILEVLRLVVEEGTGRRAKIEGYSVAGKTGTAQMLRPDGRGYSADRFLSSFIGIAPAALPRIVVLVSLKGTTHAGGHYGGVVAAPAARRIIERTLAHLNVPRTHPLPLAQGGNP
jgi:cell division protein FtsI (penicillin-binding protein 3)